ncbi:MAG: hypothetical protein PHE55_13280 [Methylococcaceae bacterium]|nr:hypothetical protein [Methylococcaceae bacterium]
MQRHDLLKPRGMGPAGERTKTTARKPFEWLLNFSEPGSPNRGSLMPRTHKDIQTPRVHPIDVRRLQEPLDRQANHYT